MIEKAFSKGSKFSGASHISGQISGGTGGELSRDIRSITVNWTEKRFLKSNIQHSDGAFFVPYCPNGINYCTPNGADVLSSEFTGCWFAKYSLGGGNRVAHVATPECNDAWQALQQQSGFIMHACFKPTDSVTLDMAKKAGGSSSIALIMGLITGDNRCFTIVGSKSTTDDSVTVSKIIKV